jgi:propionate CoA-transferase
VPPGIDVERDILAHMAFRPIVREPRPMLQAIFEDRPMDLRRHLLERDLESRITWDERRGTLFLNFAGLEVATADQVDRIGAAVEAVCDRIGRRVPVVVNYEGFDLAAPMADRYAALVARLEATRYTRVSRYTTSAFMRLKLGRTLERYVAPHVFESQAEAQAFHDQLR